MDRENERLRKQIFAKKSKARRAYNTGHARLLTAPEMINALLHDNHVKSMKSLMKEMQPRFRAIKKELTRTRPVVVHVGVRQGLGAQAEGAAAVADVDVNTCLMIPMTKPRDYPLADIAGVGGGVGVALEQAGVEGKVGKLPSWVMMGKKTNLMAEKPAPHPIPAVTDQAPAEA
ncbi:hypothetical protein B0H10DRAFT_2236618 [Mycena sp. CBHHK59/15]|nr:hypothetical protein B0H10DRAFT_2236618 [Mycena sp. CBHHK59/15]